MCLTAFSAAPSYEQLCQDGRKHLLNEEYSAALDAYSQAVKVDAQRPLAYVGQALACREVKQYDQAIEAARRAIEADPDETTALVIRGTAYHALQQYDLAKADFEKVIQLAPTTACAYAELGRVHMDQGEEDRALFNFSKALELDADDHPTYVARAKLHCRRGHFGSAVRDYTEAIRVQPDSAAYRFLRAQANFDNRNYAPAADDAGKAIELDERFAAAYVLQGAALYHQREYEAAKPLLQKAKEIAPMDAGACLWLGKTHLDLGEMEEAKAELEKALEMDDQYVAAYRALAEIYEATEQAETATAIREKANTLETELRESAALADINRREFGASRTTNLEEFDPSTIADESLQSQSPSADLITNKVRALAEQQRKRLEPWQQQLEVCEAASVVPDPCSEADEIYRRSMNLLEIGDFEVADIGFQETHAKYAAAMNAFEEKVSRDHTVWLNWAQQRARQATDADQLIPFATTMASAYSQLGDKQQYADWMQRIDAQLQVNSIMNPEGSTEVLFQVAEIRNQCGDRAGAQAAIKEAAALCEGIPAVASKSIRLARCAGSLVRYGASDQWATHLSKAIQTVKQGMSSRPPWERELQLTYIQCVAYASAGAASQAYAYAQELEQKVKSSRPDTQIFASTAKAWVALGASRAKQRKPEVERIFEASYVSSTIRLMGIINKASEQYARLLLCEADQRFGASERAWAAATSFPSPTFRILSMRPVIQRQCETGHLALAREMFTCVPPSVGTIRPACQLAEAEVRFGTRSFTDLKQWVEQLPTAADQAAALAGIALGVKTGRTSSSQEVAGPDSGDVSGLPTGAASQEQTDTLHRGDCRIVGPNTRRERRARTLRPDCRQRGDLVAERGDHDHAGGGGCICSSVSLASDCQNSSEGQQHQRLSKCHQPASRVPRCCVGPDSPAPAAGKDGLRRIT